MRPRSPATTRLLDRARQILRWQGGLPLLWLALTVLVLVPVWRQRLLPMLDTPNHLALVRGWHDFHDPSYRIAEFYELRVRAVPYFLFYGSIHLLLYVFPIETANKIFLSAYLILFPLAVLALARALKRSPWLALAAFPLAFNQNWIYGFSSFLMSMVFLFLSLAVLIRWLNEGDRRYALALLITTLLTYFGHVLTWFVFGLCAIGLLLLHWRRWRRGLVAAAAMLPSCGFALVAWIEERADRAYMKHGEELVGAWKDFPTLVMEFPRRVMELFPGNLDQLVFAVLAATMLGLCLWKGTRVAEQDETEQRQLPLILIILGLAYLSLPFKVDKPLSWWYIAPRVPAMMAPLLFLLPAVKLTGLRRLALVPALIAAVALPLQLAKLYRSFSVRNAAFMRMVAQTPRGAKTLVVVRGMMRGTGSEEKSGDPASSAPVYWHFSSWPMALNGGYGPYVFDQGIPLKPKLKRPMVPGWTETDTFTLRQAPAFEFYIVRFAPEELDREPSIKQLERLGEWTLYQRIHEMTDEP